MSAASLFGTGSTGRRRGGDRQQDQAATAAGAVLVTAPRCSEPHRHDSDGVVKIEPVRCETVDLAKQQHRPSPLSNNPFARFLEASFLSTDSSVSSSSAASPRRKIDREMDDLAAVKIVSPAASCRRDTTTAVGGFDTCREYAYSAEEQDARGDCSRSSPAAAGGKVRMTQTTRSANDSYDACWTADEDEDDEGTEVLRTHVLGRTYHPINDYAPRRDDESSLFWFTYRCDFPEIAPYGITSDAGWGCMLRSAQMLLAQALRVHYRGRSWRPPHMIARRRQDPFVRSVLTWFADFPSSEDCVYSLHNMVAAGLSKYDKLPGEWYGPGTACYVIRDLVHMHERRQRSSVAGCSAAAAAACSNKVQPDRTVFRVHVASQGAVYRDDVEALMTRDSRAALEEEKKKKERECPPAHPLDVAWEEELIESVQGTSATGFAGAGKPPEWDTSLLLLIPLRLGLKTFNEEYVRSVAWAFSLPQSVGVLGGRPRGARWFYGALSDGSKIFGLDPHTVQNAPRRRQARVNGRTSSAVELSEDYVRSVHTTYPEVFSLQRVDPSVALGFYCRNRDDLESLLDSVRRWKEERPEAPELFSVADAAPDYSSSSANGDAVLSTTTTNMTGSLLDIEDDQMSDEDEYVML